MAAAGQPGPTAVRPCAPRAAFSNGSGDSSCAAEGARPVPRCAYHGPAEGKDVDELTCRDGAHQADAGPAYPAGLSLALVLFGRRLTGRRSGKGVGQSVRVGCVREAEGGGEWGAKGEATGRFQGHADIRQQRRRAQRALCRRNTHTHTHTYRARLSRARSRRQEQRREQRRARTCWPGSDSIQTQEAERLLWGRG